MNFIIKIEKYVFCILIIGLISTILLIFDILPFELKYFNLFLFIILGLYYFPLLIFVKKYDNILKEKKENILSILSSYLLMLTYSFIAIVQIVQAEPIILFGNIISILNGLAYIYFLVSGQTYRKLFIRHFIVGSLLVFISGMNSF